MLVFQVVSVQKRDDYPAKVYPNKVHPADRKNKTWGNFQLLSTHDEKFKQNTLK